MAGLPSNYYPCWGSLTALIEPDGIDLFRARLLQLHVAHKWQVLYVLMADWGREA
jgi:hypothetical protein